MVAATSHDLRERGRWLDVQGEHAVLRHPPYTPSAVQGRRNRQIARERARAETHEANGQMVG